MCHGKRQVICYFSRFFDGINTGSNNAGTQGFEFRQAFFIAG
jgi:hypothetical protein